MVSDRIKNIIFKQLYKELSKVEIIPYRDSIYFIDRENKYWYFEYEKSGKLWWRYDFFTNFFIIFSLESNDYEKIMGEWVEEVLNYKVTSTNFGGELIYPLVGEVLNCKVTSTIGNVAKVFPTVNQVLNCKVNTTTGLLHLIFPEVEEVLKLKVNTTCVSYTDGYLDVEKALNYKVDTTDYFYTTLLLGEEQVLKHKVSPTEEVVISDSPVEEALNSYVNNT